MPALVKIMTDCLFKDEEVQDGKPKNPDDMIVVEGIASRYGLHKARLESHRAEIANMLKELPPEFHKSGGGGMTFLNACLDRNGKQWGEHRDMEGLFVLGIGLGLARYCMPRDMWSVLPGGVPYITVDCEVGV